ncbi:MAG: alpha-L-rhamnosidase C-terminal domain-containing protein, partial [Phycisphaerae bacterium]
QGMMTYNNQLGYAKWLNDFHDSQSSNGALWVVVPDPSGWGGQGPYPDWESAYEFVCWDQYLYYGDGRILREHYHGLKRFFRFVMSFAPHDIAHGGLGDWISSAKLRLPLSFTATCIAYHDAVLLSRIATVLHRRKDVATFTLDAANIRHAFNQRFYKGNGIYGNAGQTAQAMPLYYGMATREMRPLVLQRLVQDVHQHQDHLDVGALGDKCLFRVLSRYGQTALAYRIATQTTYPSYGQGILHGATTLWEGWGLHPASMNHIMFGDILGWMYNDLVGIKPDPMHPGFHTILIDPHPIRALPWAGGVHDCRFGTIRSRWRWIAADLRLDITIPPATSATVTLRGAGHTVIRCNGDVLGSSTPGVRTIARSARKNGPTTVTVAPGRYEFVYRPRGLTLNSVSGGTYSGAKGASKG